MRGAYK
jgi:hypothetical protein